MIADHTCSYQCDRPACIRAQRDELVQRAEQAAAEIGRLRGEVEALRQCGVKYLGWLGVKDAENALRKDMADPEMVDRPAPVMPNGVGGLAGVRDTLIVAANNPSSHGREIGLRRIMLEQASRIDAALRAADNRDAAGVCDACGGAGMVGHYAPDGPFGEDCPACTPAAAPAGEAVAWRTKHRDVDWSFTTRPHPKDIAAGIWEPLYTTPPAPAQTTPQPADGEAVEMSPEFTDTARAALAWVLWHHQGGSSPVGQPIRFALGMGANDDLPQGMISAAMRYAARTGRATSDFHRATPPAAPVQAAPQEGEASAGQLAYRLTHSDTVKWMRDTFAAHGFGIPDRVIADAVRTARHNAEAAHPSACELGAVRELVKVWRVAVNSASTTNKQDLRPERFIRELEAALQHRGDSRGGEG